MTKPIFSFLVFTVLSFPAILSAQQPAGYIAQYPLNNSANDVSGNNNNGSLTSTTATSNRFGTINTATQFSSGSSYGSLPAAIMQDNFSIGFWFKTTMTANNGSAWYQGNSLVNAEVCGVTNDWGTALINNGKVSMGIGNPDITIFSTSDYNDGSWHFVTAVRDETDGIIILYVDGAQVATTSGTNTGPLSAPGAIGLARDATFFTAGCGSGTSPNYAGSLDDVIVYNRVLSATEVTNLYNFSSSVPLPLDWLSFTGMNAGSSVDLNWSVGDVVGNNYFEVEHSTDAQHFSSIGRLANSDGKIAANGSTSYTFTDANPSKGINYYRIEQVDLGGKFSWSNTIEITNGISSGTLSLFPNPCQNSPSLLNAQQQFVRALRVVDVSGQILRDQYVNANNSTIALDVDKLSPGYYLVQVEGVTGLMAIIPFVKL